MKKEIKEKIEEIFKEFPDIKIDEFKFVIDALAELFKSEKEKLIKEFIEGKRCLNCGKLKENWQGDLSTWCDKCLEET